MSISLPSFILSIFRLLAFNPSAFREEPGDGGDVCGADDVTSIVNDRFVELEGIEDGIVLNGVIQEACQGEALQNEKMGVTSPC